MATSMKDRTGDQDIVTTEAHNTRKKSVIKYFFGGINHDKTGRADVVLSSKQNLEKATADNTSPSSDGLASDITDTAVLSCNYSMNIEVPKQSQIGALFSFTSIFSLERKVFIVEETIDPDDVATSPLHENDDYRKELFLWSIVSAEATTQDYSASSSSSNFEKESADSCIQQMKSITLPVVSDEHTNAALDTVGEDLSGLSGSTLTSRFSEKLDGSSSIETQSASAVETDNSSLPDALVVSGCSRAKRISLRRFLFGPKKSKVDITSTSPVRSDQASDAVNPHVGSAVNISEKIEKLSGDDEYRNEINSDKGSAVTGDNGSIAEPLTDCESVTPVLHEYIPSGK